MYCQICINLLIQILGIKAPVVKVPLVYQFGADVRSDQTDVLLTFFSYACMVKISITVSIRKQVLWHFSGTATNIRENSIDWIGE